VFPSSRILCLIPSFQADISESTAAGAVELFTYLSQKHTFYTAVRNNWVAQINSKFTEAKRAPWTSRTVVEDKNKLQNRSQAFPSASSHITMAPKEQLNDALPSEGSPKAPKDDNTATLSYILRTKAQLHEFENHSQNSPLRPQVEDDIPDSWAAAWAGLRNEKREERIPDDCKTQLEDESISKMDVPTVQYNGLSPQNQSVSSSEANDQQYNCPQQEGAAVNVRKPKDENGYLYKLLQKGGDEHRLLVLYPGSYSDTIRVSIVYVLFSEKPIPEYEAISYTCGDVTKNLVTVRVIDKENGSDKGQLEIGQNLATAQTFASCRQASNDLVRCYMH
jgi:hypothetical protein